MTEFKPCPAESLRPNRNHVPLLCGGPDAGRKEYYVRCCCGTQLAYSLTEKDAIAAWNRVSDAVENQRRLTATLEAQP